MLHCEVLANCCKSYKERNDNIAWTRCGMLQLVARIECLAVKGYLYNYPGSTCGGVQVVYTSTHLSKSTASLSSRCYPVTIKLGDYLQNRRGGHGEEKVYDFNRLNTELNRICYLLALLAHHFLHVSRIRVKSLTLRLLMSYIYGAPILDVSRSHTTTQHSR